MHKIPQIYSSQGIPLQLGQQLGKGGEGTVYEIQNVSDKVAKIYHKPISSVHAAKLVGMVRAGTPRLVEIAAWSVDTLCDKPNGGMTGLIMPRVKKDYQEMALLHEFQKDRASPGRVLN